MGAPVSSIVKSMCPLDCPDTCSIDVTVQEGRVTRIDGNHRNPLTEGYICGKVRGYAEHVYHPTRVLSPLVREPGTKKGEASFREASWDEALALVTTRLRAARDGLGGESILPCYYGGSNGKFTHDSADAALFARLGASRLHRGLCAAATTTAAVALYGAMPGVALDDYAHSKLIVVWGTNPHASGIHFVPIVQRAQAAGARLIVVDVHWNEEGGERNPRVLVNPEIVAASGTITWNEGCLSVPDFQADVERSEHVTLRATDLDGNPVEIETSGLEAVCFQHEIDHLDGILFIDRISRLKRGMYVRRREKLLRACDVTGADGVAERRDVAFLEPGNEPRP